MCTADIVRNLLINREAPTLLNGFPQEMDSKRVQEDPPEIEAAMIQVSNGWLDSKGMGIIKHQQSTGM